MGVNSETKGVPGRQEIVTPCLHPGAPVPAVTTALVVVLQRDTKLRPISENSQKMTPFVGQF